MELAAQTREKIGGNLTALRSKGILPAVIYGAKTDSLPVQVDYKDFMKILRQAGESTVISLLVNSEKKNVLIHDVKANPLNGQIIHADFYQVQLDKKIKSKIPLVFTGESGAVKNLGGILIKSIHEVEVEAFPQHLPRDIQVDISVLDTFENSVHLKDLKISPEVKIIGNLEEAVASVTPPRTEAELESLKAAPVEAKVEEVKVETEEKKAEREQKKAEAEEK